MYWFKELHYACMSMQHCVMGSLIDLLLDFTSQEESNLDTPYI